MKISNDIELKKYTHFRVGGIAKNFFIPDSTEELLDLVATIENPLFISGGSNLLINDQKKYENIICLRRFDKTIAEDDGEFTIGASVPVQKLVNIISKYGYGGIEYLYSVPALLGGAIVMNAGRGRGMQKSISDHVISVKVLSEDGITWLDKSECKFDYRDSIFKKNKLIVLAAKLNFPKQSPEKAEALKKQRLIFCKEHQDDSLPNFGTVFSEASPRIMKLMQHTMLGKGVKVQFSGKCSNWVVNKDSGSYRETKKLINRTILMHRIFRKKCTLEVIDWE